MKIVWYHLQPITPQEELENVHRVVVKRYDGENTKFPTESYPLAAVRWRARDCIPTETMGSMLIRIFMPFTVYKSENSGRPEIELTC